MVTPAELGPSRSRSRGELIDKITIEIKSERITDAASYDVGTKLALLVAARDWTAPGLREVGE